MGQVVQGKSAFAERLKLTDPSSAALLRLLPTVAVLAGMVWAASRFADGGLLSRIATAFSDRWELLGLFVVLYSAAFALRAWSWAILLGAPRPSALGLFSILQVANLINHLLPLKTGDIIRAYLLARRGTSGGQAALSTVVARLLDFLSLAAIAIGLAALIWWGSAYPWGRVAALLAVAGAAAASLLYLRSQGVPSWAVGRLPTRLADLATDALAYLRDLRARSVGAALVLSLVSWLLETVALWAVVQAANVQLSLGATTQVMAITILFQAVNLTPGSLGVYEASMTAALAAHNVEPTLGLTLALATHALKYAYTLIAGPLFLSWETLGGAAARLVRRADQQASRLEIVAARLWNVLNEGKSFTPIFSTGTFLLLTIPHWAQPSFWPRAAVSLLIALPLVALFYRYDFPLKLRVALWAYLLVFFTAFRFVDLAAVLAVLGLYFAFTVVLWGSIYYHLRIGTPLSNGLRFWRLVLENPDSTSGNFLEQTPKALLLVHVLLYPLPQPWEAERALPILAFTAVLGVATVLLHQWLFTWRPATPLSPTRRRNDGTPLCRRFILIVIDGCRRDRLLEAHTPTIDRLIREGVWLDDMRAVYPARTVTCFSSMLTGAPPKVHGMRSNLVLSLGVRCQSIFEVLRSHGRRGALVGIAHLVDAFGDDVRTVSAVMKNEEIDEALLARAQQALLEENPDLLVLQFLSVDQTGHARGSYYPEYRERIEATDAIIERFLAWCESQGLLEETTVMITADHGQGRGIGGHGHLSPGELNVPGVLWGAGIPTGVKVQKPCSIMDVAPTISYFLGVPPPEQSVGQVLVDLWEEKPRRRPLIAVVVPAHNEEANIASVLKDVPSCEVLEADVRIIVVDDGSSDATGDVARLYGAQVIRHEPNRGLGAALRTGLAAAREMDADAAVYIDADGEYSPLEIPQVLAPVLAGQADYVLGSRFRGRIQGMKLSRRLGNRASSLLVSALAGRCISDGQTGLRAFSRQALAVAEIIHDYNYAQVLTLDLLRKGIRLAEVPISYQARRRGKSFIKYRQYLWRVLPAMAREILTD